MSSEKTTDIVETSQKQQIRSLFASRDALLFAVNGNVNKDGLQHVSRAVADELGGMIADLSQLLLIKGVTPLAPDDEKLAKLRGELLKGASPHPQRSRAILSNDRKSARNLLRESGKPTSPSSLKPTQAPPNR